MHKEDSAELQAAPARPETPEDQTDPSRDEHDPASARAAELHRELPVGYCTLDRSGRIGKCDPAAEHLLGRPARGASGRELAELLLPAEQERFRQHLETLFQSHELFDREFQTAGVSGQALQLQMVASAGQDQAGEWVAHVVLHDVTARRHAEAALRESEERYMHALDATLDGLWDWDVASGNVYYSPQWCRLLGFAPEEVPPRVEFFLTRLHPDHVGLVQQRIEEHFAGRTAVKQDEVRLLTKSGEYRWFLDRGQVVRRGEGGAPIRMVGTIADITRRKQAEAALVASEARTRLLIRAASVGLWDWDLRSDEVYFSPEWKQQLGYSDDEIPNRFEEWEQRLHPADREATLAAVREFRFGVRLAYDVEFRLRHKDGSWRWILARADVTRDAMGQAVRMMGCHIDITTRKESAAALRVSDLALRAITQGVFLTGTDRVIQWANEGLSAMTGFASEELLGRPGGCFPGAQTDPQALAAVEAAFASRTEFAGEILSFRRDGSTFWNDFTMSPVRDECGTCTHFICVTRDVSVRHREQAERAALEAQLQQAQKMESVGRLAGGIAHDFNNMLGVILGHAELALQRGKPGEATLADLEQIQTAATRSADLTRQLLAFARKQTVVPRVLDLNTTVADMLKMLALLIGEDIAVTWTPSAKLWPVKMDPSQMEQVLTNLCVNARDAIQGVGRIAIRTDNTVIHPHDPALPLGVEPGEYVRLTVTDNGMGMAAATMAQVFEPFFTTKGAGLGTGLGLSMVYGAVRQNHGFVTVSSDLGHGARFEIHLPRSKDSRGLGLAPVASRTSGIPTSGDETILLVEDEPALLRLTEQILSGAGYHVLSAASPAEAVRVAQAHTGTIRLLLTDVIMPEMNGRELGNLLTCRFAQMEKLFMSGHTSDVIARNGVLEDDLHFIQKPFTPEGLLLRVRDTLDVAHI